MACAGPRGVGRTPREAPPNGRIELHGLGESWFAPDAEPTLELRVAAGAPPVLGSTRVDGAVLVFEPRFALEPGLGYRVVARRADGRELERRITLARRSVKPSTAVVRVYPTANEPLPANLLRLYVCFSAPMRRGEAYRHVRILDAAGREVEDVLLELEPELWDPETRRLTLLFDPGRLKQGLRQRRELGPTLVPDREYTLAIDAAWRDARGAPLRIGHRATFRTTVPDETSPDPTRWRLSSPAAGTRAPLLVELDEQLDHALLERMLAVRGPDGSALAGSVALGPFERIWSWTPARPWAPGPHVLVVDRVLEDLAGNGIDRTFAVALDAGPIETLTVPVRLAFEVGR